MPKDSEINPSLDELREIESELDRAEDDLEEDDEGFVRHEWTGVEDYDDDPLGDDDFDDFDED